MILVSKIIVGLLLLSLIMFFHEWGHYIVGRLLSFKVLSFNIFMGPNLFSRLAQSGVRYNLKSLPIGASVEFAGELDEEDPVSGKLVSSGAETLGSSGELFFERPRWARALVAVAGPAMNFITAFLAFLIIFAWQGVAVPVQDEVPRELHSVAQEAGLEPGDRLLSYNGVRLLTSFDLSLIELRATPGPVELWVQKPTGEKNLLRFQRQAKVKPLLGITYEPAGQDLRVVAVDPRGNDGRPIFKPGDLIQRIGGLPVQDKAAWTDLIARQSEAGEPVAVEIVRDGRKETLLSVPTSISVLEPSGIFYRVEHGLWPSFTQALKTPVSLVKLTFQSLGMLIRGELSARQNLAGPIRLVQMVGDNVHGTEGLSQKFLTFLMLFGSISVAIGFTQLIPIPPFDGHHLLILGIEGLRRRDLSVKTKHAIATAGFFLLIFLVLLTFYLDLSHLFMR